MTPLFIAEVKTKSPFKLFRVQGTGLWHVWGVAIGCLSITWWDAFDEKACFEVVWKRKIVVTYG